MIGALSSLGIDAAIISHQKNDKDFEFAAWVVDLTKGFFASLLLFFLAPAIANFSSTGDLGAELLRLFSPWFFIISCRNIGVVILRKHLKFEKISILELTNVAGSSLLSLMFLYYTGDIRSIIWGLLIGAFLYVFLTYIIVDYRVDYSIRPLPFKKIFAFSGWLVAAGQINAVVDNGLTLLVGHKFGASTLAFLDRSDFLTRKCAAQIGELFWRVGLPSLSKIKNDNGKIRPFFKTSVYYLSNTSAWFLVFLTLLFPFYARIYLSETWIEVVDLLGIFSVVAWLVVLTIPSGVLLQAFKQTKIIFYVSIIRIGLGLLFYYLLIYFSNLYLVPVYLGMTAIIIILLHSIFIGSHLPLGYLDIIKPAVYGLLFPSLAYVTLTKISFGSIWILMLILAANTIINYRIFKNIAVHEELKK